MGLPTEPFALTPGDIPTEPLPLIRRSAAVVAPEHRPQAPLSPAGDNDYAASLPGAAAGTQPPSTPDDGCCP